MSKTNGSFRTTALGSTVCELLRRSFPDIMDSGFTAQMESELDDIARGEREWTPVLGEFYGGFSRSVEEALKIERMAVADEVTEQTCDECGKFMAVKMEPLRAVPVLHGLPGVPQQQAVPGAHRRRLPEVRRRRPVAAARAQEGRQAVLRLLQVPRLRLHGAAAPPSLRRARSATSCLWRPAATAHAARGATSAGPAPESEPETAEERVEVAV